MSVRAALAVYDDAALEALANRGLLRRAAKDLEAGKVAIVEESGATIAITADGEQVEIGPGGPRAARCTCPATTVCRHKLAAVLLLRSAAAVRRASEPGAASPTASAPEPAPSSLDPVAEVLAIDAKTLVKWAGKASMRAALGLIRDHPPVIEHDGAALRVRLGMGWPPVLILAGQISGPQGLDGIVSKVAGTRMRALHAAAVLAVWHEQGRDLADVAGMLPETASPELPDAEFLSAVKSTLESALSTAISQAPETLEEQLFLLSVSSRADHLPALSRRLRQLSGGIRRRRTRDFTIQPAELLSGMAATYALADALSATKEPLAVAPLRGVARDRYAPAGPLALVGLAARLWETRGGARGVTGYFYSAAMQRVLTVGLARVGEHHRLFNPVTAFHYESLWRAGPLRELIGARLDLQDARLSGEGRISLAQETVGWKTVWTADAAEMGGSPIAFDDWETLQADMQDRFAVKLSGRRDGPVLVALLPAGQVLPRFDPVVQRTIWPLQDSRGRWLAVQVPHSTITAGMAERLEMITASARIEMVFVEIIPEGERFLPLPLALLVRPGPNAAAEHVLLDPCLVEASEPVPRPIATPAPSEQPSIPITRAPGAARGLLLSEIHEALLARAELGLIAAAPQHENLFAAFARRARGMGLSMLADACDSVSRANPRAAARTALRLAHLADRAISMDRRLPLL